MSNSHWLRIWCYIRLKLLWAKNSDQFLIVQPSKIYHQAHHLLKVQVTQLYPTLCDSMDYPWNSPGQNTGVGSHSLLQGIFPAQGSSPGLPHCRRILYQLSHRGTQSTEESIQNLSPPSLSFNSYWLSAHLPSAPAPLARTCQLLLFCRSIF